MNKIKAYFKKNKVTIMIIPKSQKSIKQWHFNLALAFSILILLILVNLALLTTTVSTRLHSTILMAQNATLKKNITIKDDQLQSLENIGDQQLEEIEVLKNTLGDTLGYFNSRLKEMDTVNQNVSQLVAMFNKETNSNVAAPISRSFNRFIDTTSDVQLPRENLLLSQAESLINNDEISELILDQGSEYSELITSLQSQIAYLDCRPDQYPTEGILSSKFGFRSDPVTGKTASHKGIDLANASGTSVHAAGDGVVIYAGWNGSFGNVIIIDHGYSYKTVYGHLKEIKTSKGNTVTKGELIGTMGSSGKSTGTHLHFEVRFNGTQIDPLKILKEN
ncbi:M23 family metallopeptidase [Fusibacter ferrireducens]|uniref:M23 family metallopeptidase n=1 Tax=Fusibacter ferrireducens TaxID=2785058 RepID=A0ABR9ZWG2_9FIRM|nr:M23 family metallopeptidase [Fusibacter ferrireducens]MBF4694812.1 M23 family metallopeptidase [Fusibacter ferrireducens]